MHQVLIPKYIVRLFLFPFLFRFIEPACMLYAPSIETTDPRSRNELIEMRASAYTRLLFDYPT